MKSIFKKIAFVLVLAMVVTMMPAKAAAAASSDEPQFYPTLRLYIDGDATGSIPAEKYAKTWNKDGYKISFTSDDTEIATVNSKGYVRAVSVGKTNINATFIPEDGGKEITKTCIVTVKKNAVAAGIGAKNKAQLEGGIEIGTELQLTAVRKDADGNTARKGKVDITDGMRFESSDENIFTVGATKGKLTAVGEGEATLKVWAVQSEGRDPETGEYKATTPIKEYTVKVLAKPIEVLQTAYNKFIMTFPNHEEAEVARKGIQAALDTAYAHVSEETNLVKIYKVLADSKNERREVFARAVGYYNGTDNTLVVTMFNELEEQTRYVINYKNHPDMFIDTPEYVAEDLTLEGYRIEADKDHSVQGIHAYLYTRDKNTNNKILIGTNEPDSSCARYLRWYDGLELEDVTGLETNSDYQFDAYEGRVYFYGTDRNLKVKVKGNFEDWIRNVTGRVTKTITGYGELTPYGDEIEVKNFNWCIVHEGPKYDTWWLNWGDKKIASDDKGYYLVVKADIKELGEDFKTKGSNQGGVDDFFTFKSLNDDKLPVNMESGEIYPPKAVLNETVGVVVYYKDQYVGTCPVEVFHYNSHFNIPEMGQNSNYNQRLSYEIAVDDSLKAYFVNNGRIVIGRGAFESSVGSNGIGESGDGNHWPTFTLTPNGNLPDHVVNVRVKCKVTYYPEDGSQAITRQCAVTFGMKNTANSKEVNRNLDFISSINMKVEADSNGENKTNVRSKDVVISAYGYDKDGYNVKRLSFVTGKDDYKVVIRYGNEAVNQSWVDTNNNSVVFKPVQIVSKQLATVTGSSVTTGSSIGSEWPVVASEVKPVIVKSQEGKYVITLYKGDDIFCNKPLNSKLLTLTDDQNKPHMTWCNSRTEEATVLSAIRASLKIKFENSDVENEVYYGYVDTNGTLLRGDDYVLTGSSGQNIFIRRVRFVQKIGEAYLEHLIPIERTVIYNTNSYN